VSAFTAKDVAHLAELARIDLTSDELEHLAGELSVIEQAVAKVNQAPLENVPLTSHPIPKVNVFREDIVEPSLGVAQALEAAPDSEADQFKVPQILGEEQ